MISISIKRNIIMNLIPILEKKGYQIRYCSQPSNDHLVVQIHFFQFWTLGMFWKTLFVIAQYDKKHDITNIDIIHGTIFKNIFGIEIFNGSQRNDELRVSEYIRSCFP